MRPQRGPLQRRQLRAAPAAGEGEEPLQGRRHRPDYLLAIFGLALMSIGLIVVYSISPALSQAVGVSENHYTNKQLLTIGLSVAAFIAAAMTPLRWLKSMQKPLLIVAALLTLVTLVTPVNPAFPAHRWIHMGSFSFQSVEVVKLAVLVWLAALLARRMREGSIGSMPETLKPIAIAIGLLAVFVAGLQSDLGSMGVLMAMIGTMAFVAGLPMRKILLVGVSILLIASLAVASTPYRRDRLATFLNPSADCQDAGYQACQALVAVGSGGLAGLGLGKSVQAYGYLPLAANDSIFAVYAEKFGFIGSVGLLGLLAAFFGRIKRVAELAPDMFSRLLAAGILAWLSVQAVINIGAMIGLLPLKGITLPLISNGGTSAVVVAAAVGLIFQISYYTTHTAPRPSGPTSDELSNNRGQTYDNNRDRRRFRGAYHPNPGSRARA